MPCIIPAQVNSKYEITNKVGDATGKLYSRIKENEGDDSVIIKLEEVRFPFLSFFGVGGGTAGGGGCADGAGRVLVAD